MSLDEQITIAEPNRITFGPDKFGVEKKLKRHNYYKKYYLNHRNSILSRMKEKNKQNPEPKRAYNKQFYKENTVRERQKHKEYYNKVRYSVISEKLKELRREMFSVYGTICNCCKENNFKFLTLDHVNNDGNLHRKKVTGLRLLKDLKAQGWPKDRFQILCMNCNFGKAQNKGVCPHYD
jgi:hypothetical protein